MSSYIMLYSCIYARLQARRAHSPQQLHRRVRLPALGARAHGGAADDDVRAQGPLLHLSEEPQGPLPLLAPLASRDGAAVREGVGPQAAASKLRQRGHGRLPPQASPAGADGRVVRDKARSAAVVPGGFQEYC